MCGVSVKSIFGKKWDAFWKSFENTMDQLGPAIEESVESIQVGNIVHGNMSGGDYCGQSIIQKNGHVEIRGKIKSLKINGKTVDLKGIV